MRVNWRIFLVLLTVLVTSVFFWACGGGGDGGNPASKYLFVGNTEDDTISRFAIDADTGELSFLGTTGLPFESGPTGLVMDPADKYLYVANSNARPDDWLGNGSVSVLEYDSSSGGLIETPSSPFPANSMALQIAITPSGEFLFTTDQLGSNITIFEVDSVTGDLTEAGFSPMTENEAHGISMHPSGDFVYMANEGDDEVAGYSINAVSGSLTPVPGSPYNVNLIHNWISITPDGRYLYSSSARNTADEIYGFSIDNISGELSTVTGAPFTTPGTGLRATAITNTGKYIYVTQWVNGSIMGYSIDDADGTLTAIPNMPAACNTSNANPKALVVDNSDKYLYVANYSDESVDLFHIDDATGELNLIDTYPTGAGPKVLIAVP